MLSLSRSLYSTSRHSGAKGAKKKPQQEVSHDREVPVVVQVETRAASVPTQLGNKHNAGATNRLSVSLVCGGSVLSICQCDCFWTQAVSYRANGLSVFFHWFGILLLLTGGKRKHTSNDQTEARSAGKENVPAQGMPAGKSAGKGFVPVAMGKPRVQ